MAVNDTAFYGQDKPFRKKKTKKNALVSELILIFLILIAIGLLVTSKAFYIQEIVVEGNNTISAEQIIGISEIQKNTNLFTVAKKKSENQIKQIPYIEDVKIKKVLPNQIKLIVEERTVEYVLQLANSYVYINRQGFVLEISNDKPEVPMILGFITDLSNIKENDRLEKSDLQKMNVVIKIMETAKANQIENLITKIDISDEKDYMVYFDTEGKIAYLGNGNELNTRFLYIKKLLEIRKGESGEIFVDGDLNSEDVYFRKQE